MQRCLLARHLCMIALHCVFLRQQDSNFKVCKQTRNQNHIEVDYSNEIETPKSVRQISLNELEIAHYRTPPVRIETAVTEPKLNIADTSDSMIQNNMVEIHKLGKIANKYVHVPSCILAA